MSVESVQFERRAAQRFEFLLPVRVRLAGCPDETLGLTQNLSAGGVFFYSEAPLEAGQSVELTLVMPAEITLAETMPVCCHGTVTRVLSPEVGTNFGVAVRTGSFEFLAGAEDAGSKMAFPRVSGGQEASGERSSGVVGSPRPG
jgi:hypothetical protein